MYTIEINGLRAEKQKSLIYFEKEIENKTEHSRLYKEVKDEVKNLYIEIFKSKPESFYKAVQRLFDQKRKTPDIKISGKLNMDVKFFGFNNKKVTHDEDELISSRTNE